MTAARLPDPARGRPLELILDGKPIVAYPGETIATALLAAGRRAFRRTGRGDPRGPFCNMGVCFDCLVTVDGAAGVRACMTAARDGMRVGTESGDGTG